MIERTESLRCSGSIADQLLDERQSYDLTACVELDRAYFALRQARLGMEFAETEAPGTTHLVEMLGVTILGLFFTPASYVARDHIWCAKRNNGGLLPLP